MPQRGSLRVLFGPHDEFGDSPLKIGLPGFELALNGHGHALFHAIDQRRIAEHRIHPYIGGKRCMAMDPGQELCPHMLSNHRQHALPLRLHRVQFFQFPRIALRVHFEQVAPGVRLYGGTGFFGQGVREIDVLLR